MVSSPASTQDREPQVSGEWSVRRGWLWDLTEGLPVCGRRLQNMAFRTCQSRCNLRPKTHLSGYLILFPWTCQGPKLLGTTEHEGRKGVHPPSSSFHCHCPSSFSSFLLSFLKVCLQGFPGGCHSLVMLRHHSDLLLP